MINFYKSAAWAVAALIPATAFAAGTFITPAVNVGNNLEIESRVALSAPAPTGGLAVEVTSSDPNRVLLSLQAEQKGTPAITVRIAEGQRSSPEFYFHGLGNDGTVRYEASAPGYDAGHGDVTLTSSGLILKGPNAIGSTLRTTPRSWAAKILVYAAQFDPAGEFIGTQRVRGGYNVKVKIASTNPAVAGVAEPELTIESGEFAVGTELRTLTAGTTELIATAPGFRHDSKIQRLPIELVAPSISILDEMHLGNNLQINTALTLGEPAPEGGLKVTLTSKDPSRMLLATGPHEKGSPSIVITVPAGANSAAYSVHGMASEGTATYIATAPGFREREATLPLVPSGVIITGPTGLPDEAEVLRPEIPLAPNGFIAKVSEAKQVPVTMYTVRLDPKTHRAADITTQLLRSDITLKVKLRNDNPELGELPQWVTIEGGKGQGTVHFVPKLAGNGNFTFETPEGFTRPTNATDLKAVISQ